MYVSQFQYLPISLMFLRIPLERVFAAPGVDVTLGCNIVGSPIPQVMK